MQVELWLLLVHRRGNARGEMRQLRLQRERWLRQTIRPGLLVPTLGDE